MPKSFSELNKFFEDFLSAEALKDEEIKIKIRTKRKGGEGIKEAKQKLGIERGF